MLDVVTPNAAYEAHGSKVYAIYNTVTKEWYHISRVSRWRSSPRYYTLKQLRFAMTACSFSWDVLYILRNLAGQNNPKRYDYQHRYTNSEIEIHVFDAPNRIGTKRVTDFYALNQDDEACRFGRHSSKLRYLDPNPKKKIKDVSSILKAAMNHDPDMSVDDLVELVRRGLTESCTKAEGSS